MEMVEIIFSCKILVHGCDPQKDREFLCLVLQTFGLTYVGRQTDRHTVLCTCSQMLTRPHGITVQKVCLLAGRTELEAQFSVRSGHQEWWMSIIIPYLTDCLNYYIYPAVGCRIVGRGNLIASGNAIQRPCRNFLLPHVLRHTVANICMSACLWQAAPCAVHSNDYHPQLQWTSEMMVQVKLSLSALWKHTGGCGGTGWL
jgi:hypothetical protein